MTVRILFALLGTLFMTTVEAQAPQPPAAPAANPSVPEPPGLPMTRVQAPQPPSAASAGAAQPGVASPGAPAGMHTRSGEASMLGRFFFTPNERARLDELRQRPALQRVETVKAQPPPPPPAPRYVTVNGVVRRSDGESTVWLDNQPVQGRQAADGLVVTPARGQPPSHVTVRVPQTGRSIDVKVGQQVEVNSGTVREAYRAPAPAPAPTTGTSRADAPGARTGIRRSDREREFLRDLVREIEAESAAAAGANRPNVSAPSDGARR